MAKFKTEKTQIEFVPEVKTEEKKRYVIKISENSKIPGWLKKKVDKGNSAISLPLTTSQKNELQNLHIKVKEV